MTAFDAAAPTVPPTPSARPAAPFLIRIPGPVWFLGRERDYWRLMLRGAALLAVTLGIYRFWLTTDQRRFLWCNTEVFGQTLEYIGTARELLIGFLFAIAILIPIYLLIFLATLDLGLLGQLAGVVGFTALSVLGQYALFRARRYRLSRTVYRGIRFHQTGSAIRYALVASLWWVFIILTLGLAYPWAQASLERYKLRNTYLGNLQGRFEGSGARLFLKGFVMWLVTVGPFIAALIGAAALLSQADMDIINNIVESITNDDDDALEKFFNNNPTLAMPLIGAGLGLIWSLIAASFLYPAFQAILWRWWASGLRFGDVAAQSDLRIGQVYGAYLGFVGWSLILSLVASIVVAVLIVLFSGVGAMTKAFEGSGDMESVGFAAVAAAIVIYVITTLVYSAIYHVKLKLAIWRMVAQSVDISNPATLDNVSSVGAPASPVGEGLADALSVGGF